MYFRNLEGFGDHLIRRLETKIPSKRKCVLDLIPSCDIFFQNMAVSFNLDAPSALITDGHIHLGVGLYHSPAHSGIKFFIAHSTVSKILTPREYENIFIFQFYGRFKVNICTDLE